jgi:hypothetical protein
MTPLTTSPKQQERFGWTPSIASARRAAERAVRAAMVASSWAGRSGVGHVAAADAVRAAGRAQLAAVMAERSASREESTMFAAMAQLLSEAALDADKRVAGAMAASLWASEDLRGGLIRTA